MRVCCCTLPQYNPQACEGCSNAQEYDSPKVYLTPEDEEMVVVEG